MMHNEKKLSVTDRWKDLAQTKTWVDIFEATVRGFPDNEALVFWESKQRFTYREYKEKVDEMAKGLYAIGVRKGTHVGLWMTNCPAWCFARLAIYKLGAVMIPFHTRYKLDGSECADDWQNFQLDGYGTWLWGLTEHINITGDNVLITKFSESIRLTINYLKHFWFTPNYDCWEEFNDKIHPSTLACIYGGLKSINQFIHDREIPDICIKIRELILRKGVYKGRITKYFGSTSVDANLLWLIIPLLLLSILGFTRTQLRFLILDFIMEY